MFFFSDLNVLDSLVSNKIVVVIVISLLVLTLLIIIMIALYMKHNYDTKIFRLREAGLLNFKRGNIDGINPDLCMNDQANLLPYDKRFEFSRKTLKLGERLGAGAFGIVVKGIAQGILPHEDETVVAVKTVNTNADNEAFKALIAELKIMIHLGKHLNIMNLLGAVTKSIEKRELLMIVEFCCFGNLQDFLQSHRRSFKNQIVDDKIVVAVEDDVNQAGTSQSSYVAMPEMASDKGAINMDVLIDGSRIFINTTNLVSWSYQISNGMDYLATRKIIHGDLAARNVLLCHDNIVKICDFGLAKSLYRNYTYKCKEGAKLPFKWLALEIMTDRMFSVQSDVWAFGNLIICHFFTTSNM
jgi:FMS-like tyrosine kinase 1